MDDLLVNMHAIADAGKLTDDELAAAIERDVWPTLASTAEVLVLEAITRLRKEG